MPKKLKTGKKLKTAKKLTKKAPLSFQWGVGRS